jgi:hypothetical protein
LIRSIRLCFFGKQILKHKPKGEFDDEAESLSETLWSDCVRVDPERHLSDRGFRPGKIVPGAIPTQQQVDRLPAQVLPRLPGTPVSARGLR